MTAICSLSFLAVSLACVGLWLSARRLPRASRARLENVRAARQKTRRSTGMMAWRARRQQAFLTQLPNALELMANALRTGLGLNSAFDLVAEELADPLGGEFAKMVAEIKLDSSLEQALDHLIERNPSGEIRLLAQAIMLHKQVGGNLAEVLDNLDRTIRERFTLQRELRSLTAEQRLTAWILGLLPLGVGLGLAVLNPAYVLTLFTTTPGRYLLGFVVVLQLVGFLVLRRILRVEF